MRAAFLFLTLCALAANLPAALAASDDGAKVRALSESRRTDLLAPLEARRLEAETIRLIAEAYRTLSETELNDQRARLIAVEIQRLQQRMRITEHEFSRIARADFEMQQEMQLIERNVSLVRPLILGRSSWKTWVGLEALMLQTGDAVLISKVMFDTPVPALPASEFVPASAGIRFSGGNLGEFYGFVRENELSFRKFGQAHRHIMHVVAMISTAAELRIRELRDINQAVRLTIAGIE